MNVLKTLSLTGFAALALTSLTGAAKAGDCGSFCHGHKFPNQKFVTPFAPGVKAPGIVAPVGPKVGAPIAGAPINGAPINGAPVAPKAPAVGAPINGAPVAPGAAAPIAPPAAVAPGAPVPAAPIAPGAPGRVAVPGNPAVPPPSIEKIDDGVPGGKVAGSPRPDETELPQARSVQPTSSNGR